MLTSFDDPNIQNITKMIFGGKMCFIEVRFHSKCYPWSLSRAKITNNTYIFNTPFCGVAKSWRHKYIFFRNILLKGLILNRVKVGRLHSFEVIIKFMEMGQVKVKVTPNFITNLVAFIKSGKRFNVPKDWSN